VYALSHVLQRSSILITTFEFIYIKLLRISHFFSLLASWRTNWQPPYSYTTHGHSPTNGQHSTWESDKANNLSSQNRKHHNLKYRGEDKTRASAPTASHASLSFVPRRILHNEHDEIEVTLLDRHCLPPPRYTNPSVKFMEDSRRKIRLPCRLEQR